MHDAGWDRVHDFLSRKLADRRVGGPARGRGQRTGRTRPARDGRAWISGISTGDFRPGTIDRNCRGLTEDYFMAGQIVFGVLMLIVFALWQMVKPGKSVFDK